MSAEKILELLKTVERKGMEDMIQWLNDNNYWTAKGSKNYHGNYAGGLVDHSWNLYTLYIELQEKFNYHVPVETSILCSFLHDVVKCHAKYNGFTDNIQGHGRYSTNIVKDLMELTSLEEQIIQFHMGMYGCLGYYDRHELSDVQTAFNNKMVKLFYFCDDMVSQFVDVKR